MFDMALNMPLLINVFNVIASSRPLRHTTRARINRRNYSSQRLIWVAQTSEYLKIKLLDSILHNEKSELLIGKEIVQINGSIKQLNHLDLSYL